MDWLDFSNFGSLKSTETLARGAVWAALVDFSNFGSLKSTETGVEKHHVIVVERISAISAR